MHPTPYLGTLSKREKGKIFVKSLVLPSCNSLFFEVDEDLATAKTVEVEDDTGAAHLAVKFRFAPCSRRKCTISICPCKQKEINLFWIMHPTNLAKVNKICKQTK